MHLESHGRLDKAQKAGPHLRDSDSVGLRRGLRIHKSDKFTDDAAVATLGTAR